MRPSRWCGSRSPSCPRQCLTRPARRFSARPQRRSAAPSLGSSREPRRAHRRGCAGGAGRRRSSSAIGVPRGRCRRPSFLFRPCRDLCLDQHGAQTERLLLHRDHLLTKLHRRQGTVVLGPARGSGRTDRPHIPAKPPPDRLGHAADSVARAGRWSPVVRTAGGMAVVGIRAGVGG